VFAQASASSWPYRVRKSRNRKKCQCQPCCCPVTSSTGPCLTKLPSSYFQVPSHAVSGHFRSPGFRQSQPGVSAMGDVDLGANFPSRKTPPISTRGDWKQRNLERSVLPLAWGPTGHGAVPVHGPHQKGNLPVLHREQRTLLHRQSASSFHMYRNCCPALAPRIRLGKHWTPWSRIWPHNFLSLSPEPGPDRRSGLRCTRARCSVKESQVSMGIMKMVVRFPGLRIL
jgi:hypothetical protein